MKRVTGLLMLLMAMPGLVTFVTNAISDQERHDGSSPFTLTLLEPVKSAKIETSAGEETTVYNPRNPYNIFINYELGMHCAL